MDNLLLVVYDAVHVLIVFDEVLLHKLLDHFMAHLICLGAIDMLQDRLYLFMLLGSLLLE